MERGVGMPNIQDYAASLELRERLYRRTLKIVVFSQLLGGAGLAAGVTVGALLAQEMMGTERFAGMPAAVFTLGSAAAAYTVGRLSQRYGRRIGIGSGFFAGGVGALGVVWAAINGSIPLLFASLIIYGAGMATNMQARYAGTDLAGPNRRAKAVSVAMVATTAGAVAGPNLVGVTGRFAESLGAPALSGPFMLAAAAFLSAGIVMLALLRPDPLLVAAAADRAAASTGNDAAAGPAAAPAVGDRRGLMAGAAVMVLTQLVMAAIMTMTPIHMRHHGHEVGAVGFVIGMHIGAMYLPSLFTGVLVDRIGRAAMAYASGGTLLAAGALAAFAPAHSTALLVAALMLLGLGWNFGLISGTAMVIDATPPAARAKNQGTVDVLISLAGASGGALSGMMTAQFSYMALAMTGGLLSLLLIPIVLTARAGPRAAADRAR